MLRSRVFWTALAAVLSAPTVVLASERAAPEEPPILLDVPFLPQPPTLCGGAAAAMVERYWGAEGAYAEDFGSLVDGERGGITTAGLVSALRARGWLVFPMRASREIVERQLSLGRPLIALLDGGGSSLHYVVVTGRAGEKILVHDPSLGPWRVSKTKELFASWKATDFWAALVLPAPSGSKNAAATTALSATGRATETIRSAPRSLCQRLVDDAVARKGDADEVFEQLSAAARLCPSDALVARELAAYYFRQRDWSAAIAHADEAVRLDRSDAHAWSLLGASRFLDGDAAGALDAWNAVGEPELDRVEIHGLARSRQDVVYRHLGLTPGTELTSRALAMALRRSRELPTSNGARVAYRPIEKGRVEVVADVRERDLTAPLWGLLAKSSIDAAVDREARFQLNGPVRGGEVLKVRARWWRDRPALSVALSSPRMLGLPGVGTLSGYAEKQGYELGAGTTTEERRGARFELADWMTPTLRVSAGLGVDHWRRRDTWLLAKGGIEYRLFDDHVALRGEAARWTSASGGPSFNEEGASALARFGLGAAWLFRGRLDVRGASPGAPLSVWPGAGTGRVGTLLLRGYPLLAGNVVAGVGIAPTLLHGSVEAERLVWDPGLARVGIAGFYDWARASGRPGRAPGDFSSFGVGARIHVGRELLRIDGAATREGRWTLSAGWVESW